MSSKRKKKIAKNSGDLEREDDLLLARMPLSRAVQQGEKELEAATQCLQTILDDPDVKVVSIKQTMGERFTGGRSTPVYELEVVTQDECQQLILKLVIQQQPPASDTHDKESFYKHAIRVRSYQVEAEFYGNGGNGPCPAKALRKLALHLPTMLAMERGGVHDRNYNSGGNKSGAAISFLMKDLRVSHPLHPESLDMTQTRAALDWLATLHARFWEAPKLFEWAGSQSWECGSFWALHYRLQWVVDQKEKTVRAPTQKLEASWVQTLRWLQKKAPDVASMPGVKLLGARMEACRSALHCALHGDPTLPLNLLPVVYASSKATCKHKMQQHRRHVTLLHGDYKAANMFFTPQGKGSSSDCAVCDFQFAGPGLGAVDVCYFLFPDARADFGPHENSLLDYYYSRLGEHLSLLNKGDVLDDYSRETLEVHYRLAQIDFLAHMVESGWVASSTADVTLLTSVHQTLAQLDDGDTLEDYSDAIKQKMAEA